MSWLYQLIHTPLVSTPHKIPYTTLIPFALWELWIIRNKLTLEHHKIALNIPSILRRATEYHFLTTHTVKNHAMSPLYIK